MIYSQNKTGSKCNTQYTLLSLVCEVIYMRYFYKTFQSSQIYINIPSTAGSTYHIRRDRENETGQKKYNPLKKNIFTGFCVFLLKNEYILTASRVGATDCS